MSRRIGTWNTGKRKRSARLPYYIRSSDCIAYMRWREQRLNIVQTKKESEKRTFSASLSSWRTCDLLSRFFFLQRNIFSSENHCRHKRGGEVYIRMLILDAHFQEVVSGRIARATRRTRLLDSRWQELLETHVVIHRGHLYIFLSFFVSISSFRINDGSCGLKPWRVTVSDLYLYLKIFKRKMFGADPERVRSFIHLVTSTCK